MSKKFACWITGRRSNRTRRSSLILLHSCISTAVPVKVATLVQPCKNLRMTQKRKKPVLPPDCEPGAESHEWDVVTLRPLHPDEDPDPDEGFFRDSICLRCGAWKTEEVTRTTYRPPDTVSREYLDNFKQPSQP